MSKYIQLLLQNREEIKSLMDEELYDDLLIVEKKISDLYQKKLLTDEDMEIINSVAYNHSIRNLSKELQISRITLTQKFVRICNRVAFYLGGYFTDEGYLKKLQKKFNLTSEQLELLTKKLNMRCYHDISL